MKLIIGLGNPGRSYEHSRHNVGFMCLRLLASRLNITLKKGECRARTGEGSYASEALLLARPYTFMNQSGQSVACLARRYHLNPPDIVVIHDELDLDLGRIRLRQGGSSAGHKGVKSIIDCMGSADFFRVRIGIGRPFSTSEDDIVNYVLGEFTPEERATVDESISQAVQLVLCLIEEGPAKAMSRYNCPREAEN